MKRALMVQNLICLVVKGEKVRPPGGLKFIKQDQAAIIRFETSETFCLETFGDFPKWDASPSGTKVVQCPIPIPAAGL